MTFMIERTAYPGHYIALLSILDKLKKCLGNSATKATAVPNKVLTTLYFEIV